MRGEVNPQKITNKAKETLTKQRTSTVKRVADIVEECNQNQGRVQAIEVLTIGNERTLTTMIGDLSR